MLVFSDLHQDGGVISDPELFGQACRKKKHIRREKKKMCALHVSMETLKQEVRNQVSEFL